MTSPIKTNVISNLDGSITIASEQDDRIVKKLSDLNSKEKFHNRSTQYKGDSVMMREGIWGNQERMKVWMNDPANAMWRTTKGKL